MLKKLEGREGADWGQTEQPQVDEHLKGPEHQVVEDRNAWHSQNHQHTEGYLKA
jgi:hypothetical protein